MEPSVVRAVDVLEARKAAIGDGTEVWRLSSAGPCRFFVVGGVPFDEKLIMWWNFVGRTTEEIVTERNAWATGELGEVRGHSGDPLPAPPLPPGELKARLGERGRPAAAPQRPVDE